MLKDISNSSRPGISRLDVKKHRPSVVGFQRKSDPAAAVPRVSESTSLSIATQQHSKQNIPATGEEPSEDLILRRKVSELPTFPQIFDSVIGDTEERKRKDTLVLQGPQNKQQSVPTLLKVAQSYLKQEMARLSNGYRLQREMGEDFYRELVSLQTQYSMQFDSLFQLVSQRRLDKSTVTAKLVESVERIKKESLEITKAKSKLDREGNLTSKQVEDAQHQLDHILSQLHSAAKRETELQQQVQAQERIAMQSGSQLQQLKSEIHLLHEESRGPDMPVRIALLPSPSPPGLEYEDVHIKLSEVNDALNTVRQELAHSREITMKQECDIEALKERTRNAEEKLNTKDSSLSATLTALLQTNELNEKRIDKYNEEKFMLQAKLDGLTAETQNWSSRLINSKCKEDMTADQCESVLFQVETEARKFRELEALQLTCLQEIASTEQWMCDLTLSIMKSKDDTECALNALALEQQVRKQHASAHKESQHVCANLETALLAVQTELQRANPTKLNQALVGAKQKQRVGESLESQERIVWLKQEMEEVKEKLLHLDSANRLLWNEVQTLKGNIRVIARVRPLTGKEGPSRLKLSQDEIQLELRGDQLRRMGAGEEVHKFTFNRVFGMESTQHDVFGEVSAFVQSALDGYDVCLFSYGQTGSGKTWTMTGDLGSLSNRGIIPRSVGLILNQALDLKQKGWDFRLECSFVEIYNEKIRCLLSNQTVEIHEVKNQVSLKGLKRTEIKDEEEVQQLIQRANKLRQVASTNKNAESSRSHSVFTMHLMGSLMRNGERLSGSLSLCDLAGSERLKSSLATGDRLKETQAINKSLSALSTVFGTLNRKEGHIPYRNSTLTHMLKPCLSGEGKTLMIVNLSSDHADAQESLCSLRFAQEVNKTELGQAKKNIV